jgi:hypothetical protein
MADANSNSNTSTASTAPTAESIRSQIFGRGKRFKKERVTLFGATVEFRQPTVRSLLGGDDEETTAHRTARLIVENTYVPGTNDRVFSEEHIDDLMSMQFDKSLNRISELIQEFTGVSAEERKHQEGNSEETQ